MKCHACNKGRLRQITKALIYSYKGKSITLEQPGLSCSSCPDKSIPGRQTLAIRFSTPIVTMVTFTKVTAVGEGEEIFIVIPEALIQ